MRHSSVPRDASAHNGTEGAEIMPGRAKASPSRSLELRDKT